MNMFRKRHLFGVTKNGHKVLIVSKDISAIHQAHDGLTVILANGNHISGLQSLTSLTTTLEQYLAEIEPKGTKQ